MSEVYQSLSHSKWDCQYHVVFVPRRRRKVLLGRTRRQLGEIFHALARQKERQVVEAHLTLRAVSDLLQSLVDLERFELSTS